jgi:hypothetical protein
MPHIGTKWAAGVTRLEIWILVVDTLWLRGSVLLAHVGHRDHLFAMTFGRV